jgi:hypothetical protein
MRAQSGRAARQENGGLPLPVLRFEKGDCNGGALEAGHYAVRGQARKCRAAGFYFSPEIVAEGVGHANCIQHALVRGKRPLVYCFG